MEPELQAVVLMNPAVGPPLQVPVPQASVQQVEKPLEVEPVLPGLFSRDLRQVVRVEQVEAVDLSLPVLRVQVLPP